MSKLIAVVMGNGPSLNDMPPHILRDFDTYGMNYAKHQPKFYICIDDLILRKNPAGIYRLASRAETAYLCCIQKNSDNPETQRLYALPNIELVDRDTGLFKNEKWMSGGTATYVALKLAYYAGYDEVWLWGVDHDPAWSHYADSYPLNPDIVGEKRKEHMNIMERHYRMAARIYREHGRRILNFSHPSALDTIFERQNS